MLLIAVFNFSKIVKAILGGYNVNITLDIRSDCNMSHFSNRTENKVSKLTRNYYHGKFFELALFTRGINSRT